jgi:hypothetical protein
MYFELIAGAAAVGGFYRGFTTPLYNRRERGIDAGVLALGSIALIGVLIAASAMDGTLPKLEAGAVTALTTFTFFELGSYLTLGLIAGSLLRTWYRPDLDDHDQS